MYKRFITSKLTGLTRIKKQILMLSSDVFALLFSAWLAYSIRLGVLFIPNRAQTYLILAAPLIAIPIFMRFGLYRSIIRYVSEYALWVVLQAMSLAAGVWGLLAFLTETTGSDGLPRSIPFLYWMLGVLLIGGSRFIARWLLWKPVHNRFQGKQVLIYGAGDAGRQLAASLKEGRELFPAGFIDDDPKLQGRDVAGLRVYAPNDLESLIEQFDIRDVIVTLPSASSVRRHEVVAFLEHFSLKVRILPAMADIASGRHLVNMVREVDVGDLLGRDPVEADPQLLALCITGKTVMVTGGGGSIGTELCLQIAVLNPTKLLILEISEFALYQIKKTLRSLSAIEVIPYLGSVENFSLVNQILSKHRVNTIYHAAAYKHVPLVERNVLVGARNNVLGTLAIAQAAFNAKVESFVLISTDKAVRPTNVMGASKRLAEIIVQNFAAQALANNTQQSFCAVRFGNVLGSSGSVIPLFKEQINQGGPITLTSEKVTRYFMSIHEAVELVIQAGSMSKGGEIFLLDMGEPVKIYDLAKKMIRLAGYTVRDIKHPSGDIEINITGLRPGEKLYEELLIANGNAQGTTHPKIMCADEPTLSNLELANVLTSLNIAQDNLDAEAVKELLMRVATIT